MQTELFYLILFTACIWLILDDFYGSGHITNIAEKVAVAI
jgi:hypothetical protein